MAALTRRLFDCCLIFASIHLSRVRRFCWHHTSIFREYEGEASSWKRRLFTSICFLELLQAVSLSAQSPVKLTLILSTKTQRERLKYDKINCLFLSFQYRVYLLCQFYFTAIEQNVQQACETMIKGNFLFILVSPPILGVFNAVMLRGPTTLKRLSFHIVSKL